MTATVPAAAGPSDYVVTPIVEEGEREIDFKAGTRKLRDGTRESAWSIGLGYGATSWWFSVSASSRSSGLAGSIR